MEKIWIYIGLWSNIWNLHKNLDEAINYIKKNKVNVVQESNRYRSTPMYFLDQNKFLNSVIEIETDKSPFELLKLLQSCEKYLWRKKTFLNWPRIIDLDILIYNNIHLDNENLKIPHPRMSERDFVIYPLFEINKKILINWVELKKIVKKLWKTDMTIC
jgi:2-amino-4-hydroxy-6-hydroxymethyldihydropteridine diphosphokinase